MKVTCITPTGDRPEAFELCRRWMIQQTVEPDQWLVVDDGFTPLSEDLRSGMDYIRREPSEEEGHTLTKNLEIAFPLIQGDAVLFIEDDDWYGPTYVETMSSYLLKYNLVGERYARYYHVPTMRYRRIGNNNHASLCQTGITKDLFPLLKKCLPGDPYLDVRLWASYSGHLISDEKDSLKLHCSTKGLRGRKGTGTGHNPDADYYLPDYYLEYLIKWVGEDNAKLYMNHVGQSFYSAILIGRSAKDKKVVDPVISRQIPRRFSPITKKNPSDVTVITCTGDRPEVFELCRRWVKNQTRQPKQWIVVDDGYVPLLNTRGFEYHRRVPTDKDPSHTLCLNLIVGVEKAVHDKIIIMEDDDWYDPTYIEYMSTLLDKTDMVGFGNLIFYYPSIHSYMEKGTTRQPALAQTAFSRDIIPIVQEICYSASEHYELCGKGLVDSFLWKHSLDTFTKERCVRTTCSIKVANGGMVPAGAEAYPPIPEGLIRRAERNNGAEFFYRNISKKATKMTILSERYLTVGMKGMPGRKGLTSHHNIENKKYKKDLDHNLLKSILKSDARFYLELFP
jgi:hypothetical protein